MQNCGNRIGAALLRLQSLRPASSSEVSDWNWRNYYQPQMRSAGLDDRFIVRLDADQWNRKQKAAYEQADAHARNTGAIVALIGIRGIGKTMIASQILLHRLMEWYEFYETMPENRGDLPRPRGLGIYRKMAKLVMDLKSLYADFGSIDTDRQLRERELVINRSLLVVDEVHECDDQKLKNRILTDIVDCRYAARRDTILISNQTPEEFQSTTSDSILSRLSEHGCILPCKWASFRASVTSAP